MTKAKFDIKTEATRPLYAGVGVTDLAVSVVRDYVADVQKKFAGVQKDVQARITDLELEPKALRDQALTVVTARVDALSQDAKARRAAIEARVAELQKALDEGYADFAKRGETLVTRIRNQQATQDAVAAAQTTQAKAKTTNTQATKAAKTTAKTTAKKASTTAKKSSTAPKRSAKATGTSAKKAASAASKAAADGAAKVGD